MAEKPKSRKIFRKVLLLVIVLGSFSLAEKIVDNYFGLEKLKEQSQAITSVANVDIGGY